MIISLLDYLSLKITNNEMDTIKHIRQELTHSLRKLLNEIQIN